MKINSPPAAMVGSVKESAGDVPLNEKTPPVIAKLLVFLNANNMPSLATPGLAAKAASIMGSPVL